MDNFIYLIKWILIGMGFFSMGVSVVVMFRFGRIVYYKGRPGLLPLHVFLVALSYNLFLGLAITARINNLGEDLIRWPFFAIAVITGFAAMLVVARQQYTLPEEQKRPHD